MNTLNRRPALPHSAAWRRLIPAALLAASLSGCLTFSPMQLASSVTRPDPPPIPLRKPQPPAELLARAASALARAPVAVMEGLAETVISAPRDGARITVPQGLPGLTEKVGQQCSGGIGAYLGGKVHDATPSDLPDSTTATEAGTGSRAHSQTTLGSR